MKIKSLLNGYQNIINFMELLLNSKIIESDKKEKIKNAIILLHGYGGDGADIVSYTHLRDHETPEQLGWRGEL